MPAYNFQQRFAEKVRLGQKLHTIRAIRKDGRRPVAGQPMHAYTGMRTKHCRWIMRSMISKVERVRIDSDGIVSITGPFADACRTLTHAEREALALADGFVDTLEFILFFKKTYGLPFDGDLIHWQR